MKEKIKWFFKRLFCKHKECSWCRNIDLFQRISGETHYLVCQKCGKIVDTKTFIYD